MDGHGTNGHLVSDFVKKTFPQVLSNLVMGGNGKDLNRINLKNSKKKEAYKKKNFLPPLVGSLIDKQNHHIDGVLREEDIGIFMDNTASRDAKI